MVFKTGGRCLNDIFSFSYKEKFESLFSFENGIMIEVISKSFEIL